MFDESNPNIPKIFCAIYVRTPVAKSIIIGKQGAKIRDIGTRARVDMARRDRNQGVIWARGFAICDLRIGIPGSKFQILEL
ncbi:MAG: KH domain-containing protein [Acidobacteria bacterium]|nr:KH domain-containing protein [Acidobacteriota bacterium]